MEVYAGPAFSFVQDNYGRRWDFEYIASKYQVIVANFDGRGSGFRGNKIMWKNYLNLGHYEPEDQIEFARKISTDKEFIDESRIMIWGRSYGGYTTSRIMAKDGLAYDTKTEGPGEGKPPVFKCGAIVAPVTDWKYYSTIYSERYLKTPTENPEGFSKSATIQNYAIENFKDHNSVFIVHGTADDNVHFINSAALSKFMIQNGVELAGNYFQSDENHGFSLQPGLIGYYRHYTLMERLVSECLELEEVVFDDSEELISNVTTKSKRSVEEKLDHRALTKIEAARNRRVEKMGFFD